jgi:SAM-dependent methyltransferase
MDKEKELKKEETFHDEWASSIDISKVMVDESFEACTSPENRMIMQKLGIIWGKRILELGCGAGEASVYFAKKGAEVIATDLSSGMLEVVQKVAEMHNVKVKTVKCSSDNMPFDDESFDIVYAANLLHHVDINTTLIEVRRVLKTGGIFVSWDPLAHNPLINIYRKIATKVRTKDEHPIRMQQVKDIKHIFSRVDVKTTWLFTLWLFIRFYLIERVHPNKERYWKKILIEHRRLEKSYTGLEKLDNKVLKTFPFLGRYCWNIVLFARK